MDTRTKILPAGQAARIPNAACVVGYFDPLLASHARRLAEIAHQGRPVVVFIADPPAPLLEAAARAELVAGLGCVSAVAVLGDGPEPALSGLVVLDQRAADLESRAWLIRRVRSRHSGGDR